MPDKIAALISILQNDPTVGPMINGRAFDSEIPDNVSAQMPMALLLVTESGGTNPFGNSNNNFSAERFDIRHYGLTIASARALQVAVYDCLRFTRRVIPGDTETLIHWCNAASGPLMMREDPQAMRGTVLEWAQAPADPTVHWNYVLRSWQVMAADIPAVPTT